MGNTRTANDYFAELEFDDASYEDWLEMTLLYGPGEPTEEEFKEYWGEEDLPF